MNVLNQLAALIADTPAEAVPDTAIMRANQALIDHIGVSLAGTAEPVAERMIRYIGNMRSVEEAVIIGASFKTSAADAAWVNGTIGHALDYDDSNFVLGGHPSVVLFPAVLSLGQKLGSGGAAIMEAYVIGFEAMMKIARIVNFEHYEQGWHPTATLGTFGAAAASARLMGLSREETAMALGMSASMASGIKENFGTMAKPLQVGFAGQKGLTATLLAAEGLTSSSFALEGKQGFFEVYNGQGRYRLEHIDSLGAESSWEIIHPGIMFKKYACCGTTHPAVDAALELGSSYPAAPEEIRSVRVRVHPRRLPHVNRPDISTGLEAKFSLQYTVAAALVDRDLTLRHFTDEAVRRKEVRTLMERVTVEPLESNGALSQACELHVRMKSGRDYSIRLEEATDRHATEFAAHLRKKFMDCAALALDSQAAERLYRSLEQWQEVRDIRNVMNMMMFP